MTDDAPKNRILVDYTDNPAARAALAGKKPGDDFSMEIKGKVLTNGENGMEGSITKFGGDDDGKGESTARLEGERPSAESPVMIVMSGGMQNTRTL